MDPSTHQLLVESNRIGISFVLTEIDTADTFLDVADTTGVPESAARNRRNALKAYSTVLQMLPRLVLQAEERTDIVNKLALIRQRLAESGLSVES